MVRRSFPAANAALIPAVTPGTSNRSTDEHASRVLLEKFHNHPGLNVGSLVIHQCPAGLCIEGHVHVIDPDVDLAALFAEFATSTPLLNRVMVTNDICPTSSAPV